MDTVDAALDQIYAKAWEAHNESNPPEEVFHYTSAEGLCGILNKKLLFASDLFCLNDPSEFQYGRSIIRDVLATKPDVVSKALLRNLSEGPLFPHVGKNWAIYSISFCGTKDLLGQWRGYGGTAGYAIGMKVANLLKDGVARFAVHRMLYDQSKQREVVDWLVSESTLVFERHAALQDQDELLNEIGSRLVQTIFSLKHPAFCGEDEWRILMLEPFDNPDYPVQYRVSGSRIVPYIELHFDAEWVNTVVLGPTVAPDPNEQAISRILVTGGFSHAKCIASAIPFRN
jgi:hypothetical protein